MSHLLDTQYVLWSLMEPSRLGERARALLRDPETTKYVSTITFWEIGLKHSIGKLVLEGVGPQDIPQAVRGAGYEILDASANDLATSHLLPFVEGHRDPFDRLLVWQCIRNDLAFVTADKDVRAYVRHGLRLAV